MAWVVVGLVLQRFAPLHLPGWGVLEGVGMAVTFAGVAVFAWSVVELLRHGTTLEHKRATTSLVTTGPFRFSRNPIYVSLVAVLLGVAVEYDNAWWAVLVAGFAVGVHRFTVIPEEEYLEREFGDEYRRYRASARRWL